MRNSLFSEWDGRYRLVGLLVLVFAFAFVRDLRLLPLMAATTILLAVLSRLEWSFLVRRLRLPSLFIVLVVIVLPFTHGEQVLISLGFLTLRLEGIEESLVIAVRFFCIVTTAVVLINTAPLSITLQAMRALKVPELMVDMAMLVLRFLQVVGDDFRRMQRAVKLRGFQGRPLNYRSLTTAAWLGGSLLVSSYERSDWISRAMVLRGYGNGRGFAGEFQAGSRDRLLLVAFGATALIFVLVELGLRP